MAEFTLRNLDDALKEKLRVRAARNRRSMAEEIREIVRESFSRPARDRSKELKRLAAEIRALSAGREQTPAEILVRQGRDAR